MFFGFYFPPPAANLLQDCLWQPQKILKGFKSIQNCFKTNVLFLFRWFLFFFHISIARGLWEYRLVRTSKKYQSWFPNLLHFCGQWTFLTGLRVCVSFFKRTFIVFCAATTVCVCWTGSRRNAIYREQILDRTWIANIIR